MSKRIPITVGFDQSPDSLMGYAELNEESKIKFLEGMAFAPGYIKHDDGTIELIEISMVAANSVRNPYIEKDPEGSSSMATDNLIADVD